MKVVILCGGLGTRIREASDHLPKPMLPIGERPMLWHIMRRYAAFGHRDFVLCLGYRGWTIKEFFLNYHAMTSDLVVALGAKPSVEILDGAPDDWRVTLADTGEQAMTGGRIAAVRRYVEGDEPFMLTYGDGLASIDLTALEAFHRGHGKVATVTAVRPPARFGELGLTGDAVSEFAEKPNARGGFINGGYFVCDGRRIWDYLKGDQSLVFEQEPLRDLTAAGELMAFKHEGFWQPVDTLREYNQMNDHWSSGKAPWLKR